MSFKKETRFAETPLQTRICTQITMNYGADNLLTLSSSVDSEIPEWSNVIVNSFFLYEAGIRTVPTWMEAVNLDEDHICRASPTVLARERVQGPAAGVERPSSVHTGPCCCQHCCAPPFTALYYVVLICESIMSCSPTPLTCPRVSSSILINVYGVSSRFETLC